MQDVPKSVSRDHADAGSRVLHEGIRGYGGAVQNDTDLGWSHAGFVAQFQDAADPALGRIFRGGGSFVQALCARGLVPVQQVGECAAYVNGQSFHTDTQNGFLVYQKIGEQMAFMISAGSCRFALALNARSHRMVHLPVPRGCVCAWRKRPILYRQIRWL